MKITFTKEYKKCWALLQKDGRWVEGWYNSQSNKVIVKKHKTLLTAFDIDKEQEYYDMTFTTVNIFKTNNNLENIFNNQYFITGSQVYGCPNAKSDIDLAIYMPNQYLAELIYSLRDPDKADLDEIDVQYDTRSYVCRFSNLNLLIFTREDEFLAWKLATQQLLNGDPVSRDLAVKCIENYIDRFSQKPSDFKLQNPK